MALFGKSDPNKPRGTRNGFGGTEDRHRSDAELSNLSTLLSQVPPEEWEVEVIPPEEPTHRTYKRDPLTTHYVEYKRMGGADMRVTIKGVRIEVGSTIYEENTAEGRLQGPEEGEKVRMFEQRRSRSFAIMVNNQIVYSISGSDLPRDQKGTYGPKWFGQAPGWLTYCNLDEHFFGEKRREGERQEREGQETQDAAQREREEVEANFWGGLRGG